MKHRHHIIPRHAGGTDDESNIELLTVEEHAEAHRILFEKHGRWQDKVAWHFLSAVITREEARELAYRKGLQEYLNDEVRFENGKRKAALGLRRAYAEGLEPWNKGKTDCKQISDNVKRQAKEGNFHNIGDYQRGRKFDDEHRKKLSEKAMMRKKKMCEHCQHEHTPAMYARWHGDKCKQRGDADDVQI